MNCPKCGAEAQDTARFCKNCGESLEKTVIAETEKTDAEKVKSMFSSFMVVPCLLSLLSVFISSVAGEFINVLIPLPFIALFITFIVSKRKEANLAGALTFFRVSVIIDFILLWIMLAVVVVLLTLLAFGASTFLYFGKVSSLDQLYTADDAIITALFVACIPMITVVNVVVMLPLIKLLKNFGAVCRGTASLNTKLVKKVRITFFVFAVLLLVISCGFFVLSLFVEGLNYASQIAFTACVFSFFYAVLKVKN